LLPFTLDPAAEHNRPNIGHINSDRIPVSKTTIAIQGLREEIIGQIKISEFSIDEPKIIQALGFRCWVSGRPRCSQSSLCVGHRLRIIIFPLIINPDIIQASTLFDSKADFGRNLQPLLITFKEWIELPYIQIG